MELYTGVGRTHKDGLSFESIGDLVAAILEKQGFPGDEAYHMGYNEFFGALDDDIEAFIEKNKLVNTGEPRGKIVDDYARKHGVSNRYALKVLDKVKRGDRPTIKAKLGKPIPAFPKPKPPEKLQSLEPPVWSPPAMREVPKKPGTPDVW
jgi:hypothetical protein